MAKLRTTVRSSIIRPHFYRDKIARNDMWVITKLRSFTCCEKSSNSSTVRRYLASTTPRVLVRTFLELSWLATVWHFSASSTVRTRALRRSVSGYCFSLASSDNSLKSENSRRSSPRASRAFLTYNQNRGHQQFLEDVILHTVE